MRGSYFFGCFTARLSFAERGALWIAGNLEGRLRAYSDGRPRSEDFCAYVAGESFRLDVPNGDPTQDARYALGIPEAVLLDSLREEGRGKDLLIRLLPSGRPALLYADSLPHPRLDEEPDFGLRG